MGGGLRRYGVAGRELLDGYGRDEMCTSGRGQVLLPWPNRIEDGAYEFAGRSHTLPLDEPERRNAIHGLVRWSAWTVAELEPARAVVEHVLHPRPGYPFSLAIRIEYALSDGGLTVTTTATNVGSGPCPYGGGAHPYLTLGTPTVDTLVLTAPGRAVLSSNDRGIPTAGPPSTARSTTSRGRGSSAPRSSTTALRSSSATTAAPTSSSARPTMTA